MKYETNMKYGQSAQAINTFALFSQQNWTPLTVACVKS